MNHNGLKINPIIIFFINILAFIVAYYMSILLHEWGHGTVAWLYGVKNSPFDVQYGGWFLMHVDENVNYANLIQSGHGVAAALIGVAGVTVSLILLIISFILLNLNSCKHNSVRFIFVYWFFVINMISLVQYFSISPFSSEGDTGQFIHGLNISPWWIFLPGIIFIIFALWRLLTVEVIQAYIIAPIKSLLGQNIFLLLTLSTIFLFIYTHGYNPLSDKGSNALVRILSLISIVLVPVLFILCNPLRNWVKNSMALLAMHE